MLEFHQNARGGYAKGSRLMVGEGIALPIDLAKRFEVYRPVQLALAVGDRILVTAGGKSKDGEHRLSNGSLFTIEGFTRRGDIVINHDWVIDRNWGHITRGYAITSHASQGVTVDEAIVGISSQSLPATTQRTAYVAVTRGKSRVQIFTDDSKELLKAFGRTDDPLSATEISRDMQPQPHVRDWMKEQQLALSAAALAGNTQQQPRVRDWMKKQQESVQSPALSGQRRDFMQPGVPRGGMAERGMDNAR
jgi:hypothetical protein